MGETNTQSVRYTSTMQHMVPQEIKPKEGEGIYPLAQMAAKRTVTQPTENGGTPPVVAHTTGQGSGSNRADYVRHKHTDATVPRNAVYAADVEKRISYANQNRHAQHTADRPNSQYTENTVMYQGRSGYRKRHISTTNKNDMRDSNSKINKVKKVKIMDSNNVTDTQTETIDLTIERAPMYDTSDRDGQHSQTLSMCNAIKDNQPIYDAESTTALYAQALKSHEQPFDNPTIHTDADGYVNLPQSPKQCENRDTQLGKNSFLEIPTFKHIPPELILETLQEVERESL